MSRYRRPALLAGLCLSVLSLVVRTRTGDDNIFLSFGVGGAEKENTGATARRWLRGEGWGDHSAGKGQESVLSRAFRRLATARAPPGQPYFTDDEQAVIFEAAADEEEHGGHNHHGHYWHKPLHPIDGWDVTAVGLACIGLMIAAAGGIGGGGILVPLYILVLGFDPKHAIPLSNITIFGGAITNTVLNISKRHPAADRPLVDWDLILVMEPLTNDLPSLVHAMFKLIQRHVPGQKRVLPDWILAIMLIVLLAATANRTLRKGIKSYNKETEAQLKEKLNRGTSELTVVHESLVEEDNADEGDALLAASEKSLTGDREVDDREYELKQLIEGERFTPLFKVGVLTGVFVVVLAVNLLKGGGAFPSPLGIECGSYAFWGATGFIFVWVLGVSLRVREYLVERWRLKARLKYRYGEGDVEWNPKNTLRYPAVCFFAGFFAGLFGVGGGIVKGPLMLEMGVEDYAIALFVVGLAATAVGQIVVNHLVKKYKRTSFIVLSIGAVVALSAVMMGGHSLYNFMFPNPDEEGAGGFCSVGE
ncbi:unnamed protein product [Ectocarpus sp. CCAP 1310/34]|nr:unnamed protein product [Ectocarpus sp. CCAP 1310/34]